MRGRAVAGERQGVRLGRLINQLLDVLRIRAGRLELVRNEMDLAAALHAVVGRFRDEVTRKEIDVALHAPAPARGHWDRNPRIEQIDLGLRRRTRSKTGYRQPVLVTLSQDRDKVTLQGPDRGIGNDPGSPPAPVQPVRAGGFAGHVGAGMGADIAAQAAQAHGEKISVCSVPGQGSTILDGPHVACRGVGAGGGGLAQAERFACIPTAESVARTHRASTAGGAR